MQRELPLRPPVALHFTLVDQTETDKPNTTDGLTFLPVQFQGYSHLHHLHRNGDRGGKSPVEISGTDNRDELWSLDLQSHRMRGKSSDNGSCKASGCSPLPRCPLQALCKNSNYVAQSVNWMFIFQKFHGVGDVRVRIGKKFN